jgi:hypothetical protein
MFWNLKNELYIFFQKMIIISILVEAGQLQTIVKMFFALLGRVHTTTSFVCVFCLFLPCSLIIITFTMSKGLPGKHWPAN